ncbi:MAG: SUMF1/EgtB/PvdO family nonheme iron enzyme [Deltaproteobacteria bacterium]|nr:SUMF1/EgtB/PvdO family nonheme iron enzyme [Deltaproteobacteria bacterium]
MIDRLLGPLGQIAAQYGVSAEAQDALIQLVLSLHGETIGLVGSVLVPEETASDSVEGDPIRRPEGGVGVREGADSTQSWVHTAVEETETAVAHRRKEAPERYEDQGLIGQGGMGEVRRALDRALNRRVAIKAMRGELMQNPTLLRRFTDEAQVVAQLQHPGVVPVHELGWLPDGRPYFTMPEVRGRTLSHVLREYRALVGQDGRKAELSLRRLIDMFHAVCETVAYAHSRGVVHRDLKPDNIMIGGFGQVLVMDWGLAKVVSPVSGEPDEPHGAHVDLSFGLEPEGESTEEAPVGFAEDDDDRPGTQFGAVIGTPSYMPLEQAQGWLHLISPATDVYSLGAILHQILTGEPPFKGDDGRKLIRAVRAGPPDLSRLHDAAVPQELATIAERALARHAQDRYQHAGELAEQVLAWLDGARKRERALQLIAEAQDCWPAIEERRSRAAELTVEAESLREHIPPSAGPEDKRPLWDREDEAARLAREADALEVELIHLAYAALSEAPELPEAHDLLAEHYRARHAEAEARRDRVSANLWELRLRRHDRGQHRAWLQGHGVVHLRTDPPGVEVILRRYVERDRRLIAEDPRDVGPSPVRELELPLGSYLFTLSAPDRCSVRVPVALRRLERWDGVPPWAVDALPLRLPPAGVLADDDVFVSSGWFLSGGDPDSPSSLPSRRLWADGFVIKRDPITNREYLDYLNELVLDGLVDEAERAVPRERGSPGEPIYGRGADGRYRLKPDKDGDIWHLEWPVCMVNWTQARRYAAWRAQREALPWRLPTELEWEKAARGVDGRFFPWGDHLDPSFCCMSRSHLGRPLPALVSDFPLDESPYGVRGLAGNMRDWCLDLVNAEGQALQEPVTDERVVIPKIPELTPEGVFAVTRGGSWMATERNTRSAARSTIRLGAIADSIGFRLARSYRPPGRV